MAQSVVFHVILLVVVMLAAVSEAATPPGIAKNPSQATCKDPTYKQCYNLVHVCPKFCDNGCTVHCQSCKPICIGTAAPSTPEIEPPPQLPPAPPQSPTEVDSPPQSPPEVEAPPQSPPPTIPTPPTLSPPPYSPPPITPSPLTPSSPPPTTPSPPTPSSPPPTTPSQPTPSSPSPTTPSPPPPDTSSPPTDSTPPTPSSPSPTTPSPPTKFTPPASSSPPPYNHSPPTESAQPTPSSPPSNIPSPTAESTPSTPSSPPPNTPTPLTPSSLPPSTPSPSTPTPSSPSPPTWYPIPPPKPKKAKCKNSDYPKCYATEHVCPSACPNECTVDCVTCKPVCTCDMPGAVCQDPRFIGADGITFYFHGKKDKDFCLITDNNLHINGHFIGKRNKNMGRDFTWVQSIGVLFYYHKLQISAQKTSKWNDENDRISITIDGESIHLPESEGAKWQSSTLSITRIQNTNNIIVEVENQFKITAKVVPITKQESRIHNYGITEDDCFAHLDLNFKFFSLSDEVDGVLGQTYRSDYVSKVKMGVLMPVIGGDDKFTSANSFATDCSVAKFKGSREDGSSLNLELPSLRCESGLNGQGVVCKR